MAGKRQRNTKNKTVVTEGEGEVLWNWKRQKERKQKNPPESNVPRNTPETVKEQPSAEKYYRKGEIRREAKGPKKTRKSVGPPPRGNQGEKRKGQQKTNREKYTGRREGKKDCLTGIFNIGFRKGGQKARRPCY